jgi:ferredoxin
VSLRARVDPTLCLASTTCAEMAPRAYAVDERGLAYVLPGAPDAEILAGARYCPVGAIVVEDETGAQVAP